MNSDIKMADISPSDKEWLTVSVTLGSVTVKVLQPPASVRRTNIEAGQAALQRCKSAFITPGVKLKRQAGVPLYFGCEDRPGWMIRELNGKKTIGRFMSGRFIAEKPRLPTNKRVAKN